MNFYERLKTVHAVQFLGAFAKLRRATISSVISVRLSVYPSVRSRGKTLLPLDGFLCQFIFECFRKSVEKIQVSLQSGKK